MADNCEACGKPKRTLDQVAGKEPVGDTCTTWLLARPTKGARAVGCGLDAYRKLLEAQAENAKLRQELANAQGELRLLKSSVVDGALKLPG